MNAVGIDVPKESAPSPSVGWGYSPAVPFRHPHTQSAINGLIKRIRNLDGETRVCMEHTGRYYEPVATWLSDAGIFVSVVNPVLVREFGDGFLRTPNADKTDSKKTPATPLTAWQS